MSPFLEYFKPEVNNRFTNYRTLLKSFRVLLQDKENENLKILKETAKLLKLCFYGGIYSIVEKIKHKIGKYTDGFELLLYGAFQKYISFI